MGNIQVKKAIVIGDGDVGKTSILKAITGWDGNTPCVNLGSIFVIKKYHFSDTEFQLNLWDFLGKPRYDQIRKSHFLGSRIVIMVFDVCNEQSFENLKHWYDECKKVVNGNETSLILIGNKIDLTENRKITTVQAEQLAKELSAQYIEMSVVTKEGLERFEEQLVNHSIGNLI